MTGEWLKETVEEEWANVRESIAVNSVQMFLTVNFQISRVYLAATKATFHCCTVSPQEELEPLTHCLWSIL